MDHLKRFEEEVSTWGNISIHPHRFGGREFRFGSAEVGHVQTGGVIDIPFPRSTFQVRSEADFNHAVWLLRLSYLRYGVKTAPAPRELLERQSDELRLSPRFRALLEHFLPVAAGRVFRAPLTTGTGAEPQ
jgi:hypothetical protein